MTQVTLGAGLSDLEAYLDSLGTAFTAPTINGQSISSYFGSALGSASALQLSAAQIAIEFPQSGSNLYLLVDGSGLSLPLTSLNGAINLANATGTVTQALLYSGGSFSNGSVVGGTQIASLSFSSTNYTLTVGAASLSITGSGLPTTAGVVESILAGTYSGASISVSQIQVTDAGQTATFGLSSTSLTISLGDYRVVLSGSFPTSLTANQIDELATGQALTGLSSTGAVTSATVTKISTGAVVESVQSPISGGTPLSNFEIGGAGGATGLVNELVYATAGGVIVNAWNSDLVDASGTHIDTSPLGAGAFAVIASDAGEIVTSGGSALNTVILSGGGQFVEGGGSATGAYVSDGGFQLVSATPAPQGAPASQIGFSAGGASIGAVVGYHGVQVAMPTSTITGTVLQSGGTLGIVAAFSANIPVATVTNLTINSGSMIHLFGKTNLTEFWSTSGQLLIYSSGALIDTLGVNSASFGRAFSAQSDGGAGVVLTATTGSYAIRDTAANLSGVELDTLQANASVSSIVIADNNAVQASFAQLTSDATAITKLHNANGAAVALNLTDTSINLSAGIPAAAAGDSLNLASASTTAILGASQAVTLLASGDHVTLGGGSTATLRSSVTATVSAANLTATVTANPGGAVLVGAISAGVGSLAVTATGAAVSLAGQGSASFAHATTVHVLDSAIVNVSGAGLTLTAGASDSLGVIGAADTVSVTGSATRVWIGGNGQAAATANVDAVSASQASTIFLLANSRVSAGGNALTISALANDSLGVTGSADAVAVTGANSAVWIGGNGQTAAAVNVDTVSFSQGGAANITGNSRVSVSGNVVTVAAAANDSLGVTGSGDTVAVAGANSAVWIGGNGQTAGAANIDTVSFAQGGAANITGNSRVSVGGNAVAVSVGANDSVGVTGSADAVAVTGANSAVWIGGNGQTASNANIDTVTFALAGAVNISNNSRVSVSGNGLAIAAGVNDSLGVTGSGDTVTVTGANSAVWIGGNGQAASNANLDTVTFGQGGAANISGNSRVTVGGNSVAITLGVNDTLGLTGSGDTVQNFAASDKLDLANITFAQLSAATFTENGAGTSGVLTLTDASHSASVTLYGQFMAAGFSGSASAAGFSVSADSQTGALVTYIAPPH